MLITLEDLDISDISDPDVEEAMNEVAKAFRLGYHNVFSPLKILQTLAKNTNISSTSRKMYASMTASFPISGGYLKLYNIRLSIIKGKNILSQNTINENGRIIIKIRVSADLVHSKSLLSKVLLITENHKDAEFYKIIATTVAKENRMGNMLIQFDPNGGGGSTTANEYKHYQDTRERLCLCIMDSDHKYPGCSIGDSAKAVKNIDDKNNPLTLLITTKTLEIENLLPKKLLEDYLGNSNPLKNILSVYESLDNLGLTEARIYVDVKKGLRLYDIINRSADSPFHKYWEPIAEKVLAVPISLHSCPQNKTCNKKNCTCYVIPHLGPNILEQVLPYSQAYIESKMSQWVDSHIIGEWDRLGKIIIDWCCGSNQKAI